MDKMVSLIEYLKSLIDCLYNQCIYLGYSDEEIEPFIYNYMIDYNKDFNEFNMDFFNCEDYKNLDKKECLQNLIYAVYFIMKFYYNEQSELYENFAFDYFDIEQIHNALDDLFYNESFGLDLIDNFLIYLEFSEAKRKEIAETTLANNNFLKLFYKDKYVMALLVNDYNLDVSEEASLVNQINNIYEGTDYIYSEKIRK